MRLWSRLINGIFIYLKPTKWTTIIIEDEWFPWRSQVRYLEVTFDIKLIFRQHFMDITTTFFRATSALYPLICSKSILSLKIKLLIYAVFLRLIFIYGYLTWFSATITQLRRLNILQNRMLQISLGASWFGSNVQIKKDLAFPILSQHILEKVGESPN